MKEIMFLQQQLATINDISGSTSYTAGDGIGISDQNVISLTATIPSSVYQLDGASNYVSKLNFINSLSWASYTYESGITYTIGVDYNSLHNNGGFAYTSAIPADYLSSLNTATENWLALYPQENHKCRIDFNFNNLSAYAQTSAIPLSTSQLVNNSNYLSSITILARDEQTGTKDSYNILNIDFSSGFVFDSNIHQIKLNYDSISSNLNIGSIPTSTSQLTNDTNYINSLIGSNGINCAFNDVAGANPYDRSWVVELTQTIPTSTSQLFNDSGFITTSNKLNVYYDPTNYGTIFYLYYNENYDVISCHVGFDATTSIDIKKCYDETTSGLNNGDIVTFENWIKTAATEININPNDITVIGDLPSSYTANSTKVFVRRIIKQNNTTTEYISFAYEF